MEKFTVPEFSYDPETLPRELKRHYISASDEDIQSMLGAVGAKDLADLFRDIPEAVLMQEAPNIPKELAYHDLKNHMVDLASKNRRCISFLGDGLQQYKVPAIVPFVLNIRKLTTAYTPYQPERSQGTLGTHWIYQCGVSALTGFEAVNASFYERSTALFEALKCAQRLRRGSKAVVVAGTLYPADIEVLKTHADFTDLEILLAPVDPKTGRIDGAKTQEILEKQGTNLAAFAFPQVNCFGLLEEVDNLTDMARSAGARSIAVIDPILLGEGGLKPPREYGADGQGADMFVAEGQHLALGPNYGGPGLGVFGIRFNEKNKNDIRQTAGRFVGKGKDIKGRNAFAIVLSTREQHIRRDKATSNICSNQAYIATIAGAAILERGAEGFNEIAKSTREKAVALAKRLTALPSLSLAYPETPFFNEIAVKVSGGRKVSDLLDFASKEGFHAGVNISDRFASGEEVFLVSVSDIQSSADCDALADCVAKFFGENFESATTGECPSIPANYLRSSKLPLPKFSTEELQKHYTALGEQNVSPDDNIYALGSCTMKYNPYINDYAAGLPGFTDLHPQAPEQDVQGALQLVYETQEYFKAITGLPGVTTQPVAGAQGELVGIKMFQAYHRSRGEDQRDVILIPRTAHGTNPATATMAGFLAKPGVKPASGVVLVEANAEGQIDLNHLENLLEQYAGRVAGIMVTNPNTSGVFEYQFQKMSEMVHAAGGLVYMDGANMNAIAGWVDLGKMGVDAVHNNTHKTWTIPHGGGGPGDAFVAVSDKLIDFMPGRQAVRKEDGTFTWEKPKKSIGDFHRHHGNFAHKVRCYTYLRALGNEGVRRMSAVAVLSARYLFEDLKKLYPTLPAEAESVTRMHEFILTLPKEVFAEAETKGLKKSDVIPRVGKLFLDFGLHAPTVAFPEVFGLMVEPTESYTKAELDKFLSVVREIFRLASRSPEVLTTVPHFTPIDRVDEVGANKDLCLSETLSGLPEILPNRVPVADLEGASASEVSERILQAHRSSFQ